MAKLEFTEDEVAILAALSSNSLVGIHPARRSFQTKVNTAFFDTFNVTPLSVFTVKSLGGSGHTNANKIADAIDELREKQAAELANKNTLSFWYHGSLRVIENPTWESVTTPRRKVSGVELTKDGRPSNQYKHFVVNEIDW